MYSFFCHLFVIFDIIRKVALIVRAFDALQRQFSARACAHTGFNSQFLAALTHSHAAAARGVLQDAGLRAGQTLTENKPVKVCRGP